MDKRLFLWGLSNGVTVLALGGAFWLGLAIGMAAPRAHWAVSAIGTLVQVAGGVWLIREAIRLRRRSGFHSSELRHLEGVAAAQRPRILRWMMWTVIAQTVLAGLLVWICVQIRAEHLIWPSIGAVVSLHFAPLGMLFHVRAYIATAIAGTIASWVGFAVAETPYGAVLLGLGLATVMWVSAGYVLSHADRIADQACAEHWTV